MPLPLLNLYFLLCYATKTNSMSPNMTARFVAGRLDHTRVSATTWTIMPAARFAGTAARPFWAITAAANLCRPDHISESVDNFLCFSV
jgi:hypothetical protein